MAVRNRTNHATLRTCHTTILLYVEGETDERLLRGWATALNMQELLNQACFRVMRGGSKEKMKDDSKLHFDGVKHIIPLTKRIVLFDYDDDETFHPEDNNPGPQRMAT